MARSGTRQARSRLRLVVAAALVASTVLVTVHAADARPVPVVDPPAGGGEITPYTITFGPFVLGPEGTVTSQDESQGVVPRPPGDFGLKSAVFDLIDENGDPIGHHDVHLHHFVIGAVGRKDTACPDRSVVGFEAQPLIGSGMERTPLVFADPYAIPVASTDIWGAVWHLMNMSDTEKTVYVKYTLGVQYGATSENTRWVTPYWADARTCPAGTTWNVPGDGGPGAVETKSKQWEMPFDGYVLGIGGHMHDGGISMTTTHEDGTVMCENVATYKEGMLDKISGCPIHDSVKKGEKLTVMSKYDNSAPHDAVMGMAVMFLWQGHQNDPPPPTSTTTTVMDDAALLSENTAGTTSTPTPAAAVSATPALAG